MLVNSLATSYQVEIAASERRLRRGLDGGIEPIEIPPHL
jgi:hypothetical protein